MLAAVPAPLRAAGLAMVRARLGWPVLEISQDETVIVDELTADGAGWRAHFAYVFDRARTFKARCNLEMVELESLVDESEIWLVYGLIEAHQALTGSAAARRILDNWEHLVSAFVKVMPTDYRRVLQARRASSLRPPGALKVAGRGGA